MSLVTSQRQLTVLRLIRERTSITRSEISELTGLSASQISRLTSNLRDRGLITVERRIGGTEGRPTEILALAGDGRFVVGLDIGGLAQQAVVANIRGEVVASLETSLPLTTERTTILAHVVRLVNDVLARAAVNHKQVLGLGVGLRAVVDPITGVITGGPETPAWSPAWTDFAIRDELAKVFPWDRIVVDDTVRALGVAERRYGRGTGEADFIYVLADTGIGAAIMIGGRPYLGPGRTAGEIGHITIDPNGEPCACGKVGCIETIASTGALERRGRERLRDPDITIKSLLARAAAGDRIAVELLDEGGAALGRGFATVLNLLAPKLFVVGGIATTSDVYLEAVTRVARVESLKHVGSEMRIVRSNLDPLAGAAGAGTMILDVLFEPGERSQIGRRGGKAPSIGSNAEEENTGERAES